MDTLREVSREAMIPMYRIALAWVMRASGVTSVITGARTPEQVRRNAIAADLKLSVQDIAFLNGITENLRIKLGPNPDYWRERIR